MSKRTIFSIVALAILLIAVRTFSDSGKKNEAFSESVKVSLRDVGNQLLLSNQDATSLVLPIIELEKTKYQLSFQQHLPITPDSLVSIIERSFQKAELPNYYLVEVIQCADHEVAYSYKVKNSEENNIIPCRSRILPESCYIVEVKFTGNNQFINNQTLLYVLIFIVFFVIHFIFYIKNRLKTIEESRVANLTFLSIGSFQFYPEQNKLVKKAKEISLSKKECELLAIFVANPNQIIKRDELTKRVWEDNGVFVGRSLDTYISKLRKILKEDDTIKLVNVHGVGYKLEVKV